MSEAFAGFADPAVLLIAGLFVVSEALDSTGVTTWLGQAVVARAGASTRRLLLLLMLLSAVMTAVIGLNGTIAALLPMTLVVAMRRSMLPSRLLMPLAFAGGAGSLLLLTGTPVNVVVSEAAANYAGGEFAFAEFALVGIPVLGTLVIVLLLGDRLVRDAAATSCPRTSAGMRAPSSSTTGWRTSPTCAWSRTPTSWGRREPSLGPSTRGPAGHGPGRRDRPALESGLGAPR